MTPETLEDLKNELLTRFTDEQQLVPMDDGMMPVVRLGNASLTALSFMSRAYNLGRQEGIESIRKAIQDNNDRALKNMDKEG